MLNEKFIFLGLAIAALGSIKYLLETIKGKAKPNRVTFFLWALAPLIAFAAEIKQGVGIQSLVTFWVGFSPLIILIASFVSNKSQWKLGTFDYICGALSLVGLMFWFITRVGNIAIIFAILADGLAAIPTIIKTYYHPETESRWVYLTSAIFALLTLLTLINWDFAYYSFPLYTIILNLIIFSLAQFKIGKLRST
ncbi:hypothetical protein HYT74_02765 [Candidatus Daviesbacteria bacterium]|nr:hypothetical protein [Candidatus Daviesbacteria bacterium]